MAASDLGALGGARGLNMGMQMASLLVSEAAEKHVTVGTAESLTGGLVAGTITAVSGASEVLLGGIVSYAVSVKHAVLGVDQEVLDTVGPVSEECARQMAEGARRVIGCDMAVAVTGIAGPGGAEQGKPVGTVWFGLSTPDWTSAEKQLFDGDRESVREQTVSHAIKLLREGLRDF